ncbi:hypothetical protein N0V90_001079 [Kalmusia sp. IMI 367209]|nr:hypothetical protein N0V90_001079 [Kalmusia sp. IMI 367209]
MLCQTLIFAFSSLLSPTLSAVVDTRPAEAGIIPTRSGQIGVNPVYLGPTEQYVPTVAPDNSVLYVESGQTKWKGTNSYYFWYRPVIKTVDSQAKTFATPVQVSASRVTSPTSSPGAGDVTITIVPHLKSKLEVFAEETVNTCKAVLATRQNDPEAIAAATNAFTACIYEQSVKASSQGSSIGEALSSIEVDSVALPEPPPGPALEIEAWAAALQIAKTQLRRKEAWLLTIMLTTYLSTGAILHSYKVPANPQNVVMPTATESVVECKAGAPTGVDAVRFSLVDLLVLVD